MQTKLTLPPLHINYMSNSYTDSIEYLSYIFSSKLVTTVMIMKC